MTWSKSTQWATSKSSRYWLVGECDRFDGRELFKFRGRVQCFFICLLFHILRIHRSFILPSAPRYASVGHTWARSRPLNFQIILYQTFWIIMHLVHLVIAIEYMTSRLGTSLRAQEFWKTTNHESLRPVRRGAIGHPLSSLAAHRSGFGVSSMTEPLKPLAAQWSDWQKYKSKAGEDWDTETAYLYRSLIKQAKYGHFPWSYGWSPQLEAG